MRQALSDGQFELYFQPIVERFIAMVDDNADNLSQYCCPMGTLNSELSKDHHDQQYQARAIFDLYLLWL